MWLTELSCGIGRPATLDDVPDPELDGLAEMGFDWVWLLSVWCTGRVGQRIARTSESLRREFKEMLPDLRDEDIAGRALRLPVIRCTQNSAATRPLADCAND